MSDNEDDEETFCPLCVEEMDLSDRNFLPCPCGYRVKNIVLHFNTLAIKITTNILVLGVYVVLAPYPGKFKWSLSSV